MVVVLRHRRFKNCCCSKKVMMAFSVNIDKTNVFPVICLSNEENETSAEIYAFGSLLNSFKINNNNIIDGFSSPQNAKYNITNGFKSAKLSPFVCRVSNGEYSFNSERYKIEKFYLGDEAIHGLLFDEIFDIVDHDANSNAAFVTLQYQYKKNDKGFPFNYTCTVTYKLEHNNRLTIETTIKNDSAVEIPVYDGWHPYFTLGCKIDELVIKINSDKMLEFNEKLVPTGKTIPYNKFQQDEIFGETFLDNCFLLKDNNEPACVLTNKKSGLQLTIQPDKSYPYLQIYTPEHRNSIAIENLSAAPDAFNNKMGLCVLNAGSSASFKTSFSAGLKIINL